ncbi:hypothetical protein J437_LFUL015937 [Ladona fulva]|uniref:Uncharacterized protein n=1 Tax=Ladona fulva TaxID=123851 RepID=A0A8K0KME8_LADFU|nr:hypothetical protein J437_LFUL015937 [Ladona fulva]
MCKLLHYGISSNDSRLKDIMVSGDAITPQVSTAWKSSKSSKQEWTIIPLFVKILKLLLDSLNSCITASKTKKEIDDSKDDFAENEESACDYDSEDESLSDSSSSDSFGDWSNVIAG